mmetsp:Transcript_54432/g.81013  ORF Transcript_54432/g.81013 Transcript_54432/m.81013 type:complete len:198 (-) Transcript_54432:294-887(-)
MSGVLHCEEGDYDTAHSYFLEAFEQLDQLDEKERALPCLKYMMLCRILDSLVKALKLSAMGGVGAKSDRSDVDISGMISGKQGVKYAGQDIEAMSAIAAAASRRSLKEFEEVTDKYKHELQDDLLIKHHLRILHEQLLESNLVSYTETHVHRFCTFAIPPHSIKSIYSLYFLTPDTKKRNTSRSALLNHIHVSKFPI